MRKKLALMALPLVLLFVVDRIVAFVALSDDVWDGARVAPFDPPLFNATQVDSLARFEAWLAGRGALIGQMEHDPVLGWAPRPGSGSGETAYDEYGARVSAPLDRDDSATARRVLLFGDSFTHGDEVRANETFAALLAMEHGIDARNFGVSGYGIDQALLRCKQKVGPLAVHAGDEIWLCFVPAAAMRVVNVYGPVLTHDAATISCKPRFVLDAGGAIGAPSNPFANAADVPRLLHDHDAFVREVGPLELFMQEWPQAYARRGSHWSHWFATSRILLTRLERGDRFPDAWLGDERAEVARLIVAIAESFQTIAKQSSVRFRFIVLPDGRSLRRRAGDGGVGYWDAVCRSIAQRGIEVIDLSEPLLAAGLQQSPEFWAPLGHYSLRTNQLVAQELARLR